MRHRVKSKQLNRTSGQRQILFESLLRSLFLHGHVTTTQTKAKEIKRLADKAISKAQDNSLTSRRELHKVFGKSDVVNTLVDKIAPVFTDRKSGFTSIKEVGKRRGDNTSMYRLELINQPANLGSFSKQTKKDKE